MPKALISRLFLSASAVLFFTVASARADFLISVGSGTIDPGGTLLLEIGIDSDAAPENMSDFKVILEITPLTGTGSSSLQFVDPQSEAVLEDADYVFADTSEAIADDLTTVLALASHSITIEDISVTPGGDFLNAPVTTGQLLTTLDLKHLLGDQSASATEGDTFEVSVVSIDSDFLNAAGDEIPFTAGIGTITVGAVAVPEPSSVALLMLASCGLILPRRRRRR